MCNSKRHSHPLDAAQRLDESNQAQNHRGNLWLYLTDLADLASPNHVVSRTCWMQSMRSVWACRHEGASAEGVVA